jgi:hypothetical protein
MSEYPGFGVLLARLCSHRGLDVRVLPELAGIPERDIQAVLDGADPSPVLLRRLAAALGLHAADLFVIAEALVPEELSPLDSAVGWEVHNVVAEAVRLSPELRKQLLELARSLPQQPRAKPAPAPKNYEQYPPGFGAVLVGMLANRNLDWMSSVRVLGWLTRGSLYWSSATVGMVGRGDKEMTPELLADFAAVLGIPVEDLAVLGGIELPAGGLPTHEAPADMAALIWEVRRLTANQVRQVLEEAKSMRRERR